VSALSPDQKRKRTRGSPYCECPFGTSSPSDQTWYIYPLVASPPRSASPPSTAQSPPESVPSSPAQNPASLPRYPPPAVAAYVVSFGISTAARGSSTKDHQRADSLREMGRTLCRRLFCAGLLAKITVGLPITAAQASFRSFSQMHRIGPAEIWGACAPVGTTMRQSGRTRPSLPPPQHHIQLPTSLYRICISSIAIKELPTPLPLRAQKPRPMCGGTAAR
jgi:hypothetical protein